MVSIRPNSSPLWESNVKGRKNKVHMRRNCVDEGQNVTKKAQLQILNSIWSNDKFLFSFSVDATKY